MKKNDAVLSKNKSAGVMNADNTNMHKLAKMGLPTKFEASGGKKTPA